MSRQKTYVLAVSGGIDSMVLLDMLVNPRSPVPIILDADCRYVVAHVDHGIRIDSNQDEKLVRDIAESFRCTYETTDLSLGPNTSEDSARKQRYAWLKAIMQKYDATALVTAHHQDDVLETIIINMRRGTGWRGLVSLREHDGVRRPLLGYAKADIVRYAIDNGIKWRDDSTNDDIRFMRNYIRYLIMPKLSRSQREELYALYISQCMLGQEIGHQVDMISAVAIKGNEIDRYFLSMIDRTVGAEIIRKWCRRPLELATVNRIWLFVLVARPGKRMYEDGIKLVASPSGAIVSLSDI
ncbi:MAG: tRNA lysidine(34) synthetase TilS [Candidatus Saccharimonadales bacterium]